MLCYAVGRQRLAPGKQQGRFRGRMDDPLGKFVESSAAAIDHGAAVTGSARWALRPLSLLAMRRRHCIQVGTFPPMLFSTDMLGVHSIVLLGMLLILFALNADSAESPVKANFCEEVLQRFYQSWATVSVAVGYCTSNRGILHQ